MHKNINSVLAVLLLSVLQGSITPALAVEAPATEPPATTEKFDRFTLEDNDGLVTSLAFSSGGDKLATASNDDGDDLSLKAGDGFHLAAGYGKRFDWGGMRATLGYKFDTLDAENGDAEISRFPLEAVVYKSLGERQRVGGGLVYEMSPEFELNVGGSYTVNFKDATGFLVYYGFAIGFVEFGARYTVIEYEPELSFLDDVDAGNLGFYTNFSLY